MKPITSLSAQAFGASDAHPSVVERVRRVLTEGLEEGLEEGTARRCRVARRLGMSERTLQRRLAARGVSFQCLVSELRRERAEALLATTDEPLSQVSLQVGYSEQSAFQRAFKSWTGQTPQAFRRTAASMLSHGTGFEG